MELAAIQAELAASDVDGWLLCDFRNREPLARRILGLAEERFASRRWFYWIPSAGEPVRVVSSVEPAFLDSLPGSRIVFRTWRELSSALAQALRGARRVAMQYSPDNDIPYVGLVDAGTVELVRKAAGVEVVSSADLVSRFVETFGEEGAASHRRAMAIVHRVKDEAFARIRAAVAQGRRLTDWDVHLGILASFEGAGVVPEGGPMVGIDAAPSDPHFENSPARATAFARGQCVLLDLWARERSPEAIFADVTWCAFVGSDPPGEYARIWRAVAEARDAACALAVERCGRGAPTTGAELDRAARSVIEAAGYGERFVHRTGHSIGRSVHGNGANLDDFETRDTRRILPGTCFSVEPGIYLPGRMAVRSEVDVLVTPDGKAEVSGPVQKELVLLA